MFAIIRKLFHGEMQSIVTYVLLNISIANSHATSAYEYELLAVTWHYLPIVDASTT